MPWVLLLLLPVLVLQLLVGRSKCWGQAGLTELAASGLNSLMLSWHMNTVMAAAATAAAAAAAAGAPARGAAGAASSSSSSSRLLRRRA
jgi:hypothetical protein